MTTTPLPSQVLNLTDWYLTLPTGPAKDATEVMQPALASYTSADFEVVGNAVVFTAPCGGSTTKDTKYPRCELRETKGSHDHC